MAKGSGKELVARASHLAAAALRAFFAVKCGALPRVDPRSECSDYQRVLHRSCLRYKGCCRSAPGGPLFLDESGDMRPVTGQAARALQDMKSAGRASAAVNCDASVVAATTGNLRMEKVLRFREDLFYVQRYRGCRAGASASAWRKFRC